ncbi:hypothetical protein [Ferdinandcohnia sp. Marseille-Q9671]
MKVTKINIIGFAIILFLGISEYFFKEELSIITTGLGGLIALLLGLILSSYKPKRDASDEEHNV